MTGPTGSPAGNGEAGAHSSNILRLITLKRAEEERLFTAGGVMFDQGRPLPEHLAPVLVELLGQGYLFVVEHAYPTGVSQRVCITDTGEQLLRELENNRRQELAARKPIEVSKPHAGSGATPHVEPGVP